VAVKFKPGGVDNKVEALNTSREDEKSAFDLGLPGDEDSSRPIKKN
jgi:hypothetical protein